MNNNPAERKVFVSYSRADTGVVLPLVERLEKETGIHFWIDREGIESAAQFEEVIISAIDRAEVVLFMLSDNSQHSQWTKDEITYAKNTGKRVVPVVLHGGELKGWFLFKFGRINYIDATQDDQLQRLSADIREWLHVRRGQAPHVKEVDFTETIRVSETPGASESDKKGSETNVKAKANALSLFFREHRMGCTIGLTIALTFCVVIVVVLPQMFFVHDTPPELLLEECDSLAQDSAVIDLQEELKAVSTSIFEATKDVDGGLSEDLDSVDRDLTKLEPPLQGSRRANSLFDDEDLMESEPPLSKKQTSTTTNRSINGHEYVDLGLSVKWATCNVGASSPSDYGNYYAWGETTTKSTYSAGNSKTYDISLYYRDIGGDVSDEKLMPSVNSSYNHDIGGDLSTDAARANWGGTWRLPTAAEFQELIDNCTWTWTTQGGHNGYKVTSKMNGNSIFLPAAGRRNGSSLYDAGEDGIYWASSPCGSNSSGARCLYFSGADFHVDWNGRYVGRPVRPVSE